MNDTVPHDSNQSKSERIERMVAQYGDGVLRLCCLYMGDLSSAEDAWQETFLNAFRHLDGFRQECSEKTWLTGIAVNVCRSSLRSEKRRLGHLQMLPEGEEAETLPDPAAEMLYDDTILREIHALKPKYREVILMYYYQEMTAKEIAAALGLSESAVTVRLTRARAQLKVKLQDWYDN